MRQKLANRLTLVLVFMTLIAGWLLLTGEFSSGMQVSIMGLFLATAVFLSRTLINQAFQPIDKLNQAAERVASGELDARMFTFEPEISQLANTLYDVTVRAQNTETQLEGVSSRANAILGTMRDGLLLLDVDGRVRLINEAGLQLLELNADGVNGQLFSVLVQNYELIELLQRCKRMGEEQSAFIEIGRLRAFFIVNISPLRTPDSGFLVMLQDQSRVRRLEKVRRDFVGNISHELRTPLAAVRALIETASAAFGDDPDAATDFLGRAEGEIDVMAQMISELLELSEIESGQVPVDLQPTDIDEFVIPVVNRLQPQIKRAQIAFDYQRPDALPVVVADARRMEQVLNNLLHNAIKFTPSDGRVTIKATLDKKANSVQIQVSDSGVGIPKKDLPRIFERFYKSDKARTGAGTGLGLAIVKHIMFAHGGEITADSVENKGSTFTFSLPIVG